MLTLLYQALALAYAVVAPGVMLSFAAGRAWPPPVRLVAGFVLGALTVSLASFCAAWLLQTSVKPGLVFAVATALNVLWGGVAWARRSR